ncbi:MAG: hypothetical protein U0326_30925 [Polyangiales bacterium]
MNPCTTDSCSPSTGCVTAPPPQGTACSDGNACNGAETCNASGSCTAGTALSCDDSNPAPPTRAARRPGARTACQHGLRVLRRQRLQRRRDLRRLGHVRLGDGALVRRLEPLHHRLVRALTGCAHATAAAGTACSDGNACNGAETCNAAGACTAGTALSCDDSNPAPTRARPRRDARTRTSPRARAAPTATSATATSSAPQEAPARRAIRSPASRRPCAAV